MRTTLDIDSDVLEAAKELAQRTNTTAGRMISELARRGLSIPADGRKAVSRMRGGVPLMPSRGEIVTLERVRKIRDEEGV